MGKRRKRIIKLPKKKLPKTFLCPKCGVESVRVIIQKEALANVVCGKCELKAEITASPQDQPVDIYCKFTDKFYTGELV